MNQAHLRNIAIIAHVDHGKTTLVDGMLKQTQTFAVHQQEMDQTTILDSNELERERGVTILAKNTAVFWNEYKINILDTPGHADFSGEVERVLNMADGCALLVDAAEGVLSQTRFVLSLALELGLRPIVVINKVDRKDQRVQEVETEIADLFLELATDEKQLNFPVLYAKGIEGVVGRELKLSNDYSLQITDSDDLTPLFETLIKHVPGPEGNPELPLQLQVNLFDWDNHLGKIIIGRVFQGTISQNQPVVLLKHDGSKVSARIEQLFTHQGLQRQPVNEAQAGQIVALTGISNPQIGETIAGIENPQPLPAINISEPTVKMTVSVNTSPFSGRDAEFSTSRQLHNRIDQEIETNVGLKIDQSSSGDNISLIGRGELHLSILIETMRREGYEFSLSRPEVVIKEIDGVLHEPWELVVVEVPQEYTGTITSSMAQRHGEMKNMQSFGSDFRFTFEIATRNLIGYRSELLTSTSGTAVINNSFIEFRPRGKGAEFQRGGALIAHETGMVTAYALDKAQQRAKMMVDPGEEVYKGQVVGINSKDDDMVFNVVKSKKLTNMRAASADKTVVLTPAWKPTLEQLLTMIADDEMLEVTPQFLRLRKK